MELTKEYWDRLAAFRGLAALLVALGHLVQVFVYPSSAWVAPYTGLLAQASVMMFFVISGCSIAASAHSALKHADPVRRYTSSRVARILPPLIFAIGLMWLLDLIAPHLFASGTHDFLPHQNLAREGYFFTWRSAFGAMAFLNGFWSNTPLANGPLWSLSFEVWLYAVYFLLFLAAKRQQFLPSFIAAVLFAILVRVDKTGNGFYFFKYSMIWFAGVALFFFLTHQSWHDMLSRYSFVFLICMIGLTLYFAYRFIVSDMSYDITRFNIAFGLTFALYLSIVRSGLSREIVILFRPTSRFGYTLYLIHFPIYLFVFGVFQGYLLNHLGLSWSIGVATMMFSVFVAFIASRVVERRELFLGKARR